jgi:hypothetical protein
MEIRVNDALIKHKNISEKSRIFCDKIEYIHNRKEDFFDHHLMFYLNGRLVFKIWLPNSPKDKIYKNIKESLKSVGVSYYET